MQSHRTSVRLLYWLTLASGMLKCLFFSGVVFGYASLVFVLKEDGYFSHLCFNGPDSNGTTVEGGQPVCSSSLHPTIITLYSGAFDSSSAVFLIIKVLHEQGISLRSSFLVLSLCSIMHVLRTFILMPGTHILYPVPQCYTYGLKCGKSNSHNMEQRARDEAWPVSTESSCRMNTSKDETELSRSGKGTLTSNVTECLFLLRRADFLQWIKMYKGWINTARVIRVRTRSTCNTQHRPSPKVSWDRLQVTHDPNEDKRPLNNEIPRMLWKFDDYHGFYSQE